MLKEIKIGNKKIKIKYVQKIPGEKKDVLGVFDSGDRIIYIRKQDKNEQMYTLLHEIFHCIIWQKSMHNLLKPDMEEIMCDIFAESFIQLVNNGIDDLVRGIDNGKEK